MKKRWKTLVFAALVVAIVASVGGVALAGGSFWKQTADSTGAQGRGNGASSSATVTTSVSTGALSDAETQALVFIREEEKLARDVYETLYDKWGVSEFSTIAASESRHMASFKNLLDRYGLVDPVGVDTPGAFVNDELQAAYDDLVAQGTQSVEAAYQVGVSIEQLDIADLEELIGQTTHSDISRVMNNLLRGSQNHLAAFTGLLAG
jgi:hypothetical protein